MFAKPPATLIPTTVPGARGRQFQLETRATGHVLVHAVDTRPDDDESHHMPHFGSMLRSRRMATFTVVEK